jgi:DNA-binding NarL/FixJ family response regulator
VQAIGQSAPPALASERALDGFPGDPDAPYWSMASGAEATRVAAVEKPPGRELRVVLADDDLLLRSGIASLLERPGFEVVGQAGDAEGLLTLVRELVPDLVVVDIRMPPTQTVEGLDAARTIREELPDVAIMVLSAHVDVEHAMTLLSTGRGIGYLLKSRVVDVDDFVVSLTRVARGASIVDPALVQELVAVRRRDDPLEALSPREREVLELMAEGRSNLGIAQTLWVTEGTVEKHVRSILTKLNLNEEATDHRRVLAVLAFLQSH